MNRQNPPLLGYADRLSARPKEMVEVKVSSYIDGEYTARLVRTICADPNPEGTGLVEEAVDCNFARAYPARVQPFVPGSCLKVPLAADSQLPDSFTVTAMIWPTRPGQGTQAVVSVGAAESGCAFFLGLDDAGKPRAAIRMADHNWIECVLDNPISDRYWVRLSASVSHSEGLLTLRCSGDQFTEASHAEFSGSSALKLEMMDSLMVAASEKTERQMHFNGKIDSPTIYMGQLNLDRLEAQTSSVPVFACWDFSRDISSCRVVDTGPHQLSGELVNFPARAMTGANWDGTEMCWRHLPNQYGAIHFHEDDIYDFQWETDFAFAVPDDLQSGVYGIRLEQGEQHDTIPLFVCPPRQKRTAQLCVLVSTFTYTVYGNHARPDYEPSWLDKNEAWNAYPWNPAEYPHYGCSTYNFHLDRSGICHASHRRPLFNLRPGYLTFGANACSGLRHFQADSHLTAWLENQGYAYDVITDKELHDEGVSVLSGYAAVTTGSHPEYHTAQTLDALQQYRDQGGHLAYLGGNGFYWRVAIHPENSSLIEIRRAEGGIRAWAAEPGEYYNAFDGQYGGLWRRNGRPPQALAGVGFSSQGRFFGSYYRRTPDSYDQRFSWMFEGITDELIGDFGFSGGGAAGFELDRYDRYLGSPENAVVIASSENHNDTFVLVPEEQLTHITNWPGVPNEELIRADMLYFDTSSGGAVFSTGSITFCGSLPYNDFDNNISRLMRNIFNKFLDSWHDRS